METNILIIGAGFAGAATAHYLLQRGEKDVVILEKEPLPGVHSSGRNAAMIRAEIDDPDIGRLAMAGREVLATGEMADYERNGAILLGRGDDDVSQFFPIAKGRGRWCPDDGVLDVHGLLHAYLRGVNVRYETELLSWKSEKGKGLQPLVRVQTNRGEFVANVLVNAAGAWAGPLGDLPLAPMKRHIFVTTPMPQVDPHWPFVWDDKAGLYFRPESGGLLLSVCDESRAEPGDYREDPAVLEDLAVKVPEMQPGLGDIAIGNSWAGHRTFSSDHKFAIGFDPRVEGLFHVAALGGHGVTTSPATGSLAAGLLLGDAPAAPNPFDPARLATGRPIRT